MVKHTPIILLTLLKFWIFLGKRDVERKEKEMTAGLAQGVDSENILVFRCLCK